MASEKSDETLTPKYDKAIEFLRLWCPEGRWVTTAIGPNEKKPLETQTFEAADHADCEAWLKKQGDLGMNLYFQVNPLRVVISGKRLRPKREHVEKLVGLHVDVDPPKPPKELLAPDRIAEARANRAASAAPTLWAKPDRPRRATCRAVTKIRSSR